MLHAPALRRGVALGHRGPQQESRTGDRPREDLQEHQTLADVADPERTGALQRRANRDEGYHEVGHRRPGDAEADAAQITNGKTVYSRG